MENIKKISQQIIKSLPYLPNFLFVDDISEITEQKIVGHYTFTEEAFFFKSHFVHIPITPGVILMEMMGQIGLVCLLVYLHKLHITQQKYHPILQNIESSFLKQIYVNEKLTVVSEKVYFRNGILKSNITLFNAENEICSLSNGQIRMIFDN